MICSGMVHPRPSLGHDQTDVDDDDQSDSSSSSITSTRSSNHHLTPRQARLTATISGNRNTSSPSAPTSSQPAMTPLLNRPSANRPTLLSNRETANTAAADNFRHVGNAGANRMDVSTNTSSSNEIRPSAADVGTVETVTALNSPLISLPRPSSTFRSAVDELPPINQNSSTSEEVTMSF